MRLLGRAASTARIASGRPASAAPTRALSALSSQAGNTDGATGRLAAAAAAAAALAAAAASSSAAWAESKPKYEHPLVERYATKEMSYIWSPDKKFSTWRKLWLALAESEQALGVPITDAQLKQMSEHLHDIDYACV